MDGTVSNYCCWTRDGEKTLLLLLDRDGKDPPLLDRTASNYCCWSRDGEKTLLLLDRNGMEPLLLDGTA